jgi:hypothetical protein
MFLLCTVSIISKIEKQTKEKLKNKLLIKLKVKN